MEAAAAAAAACAGYAAADMADKPMGLYAEGGHDWACFLNLALRLENQTWILASLNLVRCANSSLV